MDHLPSTGLVSALVFLGCAAACGDDGSPPVDAGSGRDAYAVDAASGLDGGPPPADAGPRDASRPTEPNECAGAPPEWVFCSSFEEGTFDIWDDYDGNPPETNTLLADPGPFDLPGNHVARLRVPPGRGGADLVKVLPSEHDRLYARWYVKWEAGYDFSAANHGSGLHAGARSFLGRSDFRPAGDEWFTAWVEPLTDPAVLNIYSYYPGMYMDCADPSGSCWGDHFPCMVDEGSTYCTRPEHRETVTPPVLEDDRWYCIELMLDGGTPTPSEAGASGALDFWVDGLEVGPWTGLWMRSDPSVQVSILWLSIFHHADHSVAGLLFDDVAVSTERVGCRAD